MRRGKVIPTIAALLALLGLVAAIRWWMLDRWGEGLYEVEDHTGRNASVMSLWSERYFGGTDHWIEVTVTEPGGKRVLNTRIDLPGDSRGPDFRARGSLSWTDDGSVVVTCPSQDFPSGLFDARFCVPQAKSRSEETENEK